MFWDEEGRSSFNSFGWSKVPSKEQEEAVRELVNKVRKFILEEIEKINKIKPKR